MFSVKPLVTGIWSRLRQSSTAKTESGPEEPSILGLPDYGTYRNNNDDQTAFSLLFKKFGFKPFSVGERDAVVPRPPHHTR